MEVDYPEQREIIVLLDSVMVGLLTSIQFCRFMLKGTWNRFAYKNHVRR